MENENRKKIRAYFIDDKPVRPMSTTETILNVGGKTALVGLGLYVLGQLFSPEPSASSNTATPSETMPGATIEEVTFEHNILENMKKGMRIHVKFSTKNLKDATLQIGAFFRFSDDSILKGVNTGYCTTEGQACVVSKSLPSSAIASFTDYILFMPYAELKLPKGEHNCRFRVQLFDLSQNKSLAISNPTEFKISKLS